MSWEWKNGYSDKYFITYIDRWPLNKSRFYVEIQYYTNFVRCLVCKGGIPVMDSRFPDPFTAMEFIESFYGQEDQM